MSVARLRVAEFEVENEDKVYLLAVEPPSDAEVVKKRFKQPDFLTFSVDGGFDFGVCIMNHGKTIDSALGGVALIDAWDESPTPFQ